MSNCWYCGYELIWQNDYDYKDYYGEGEGIVTVLSCPNCEAMVEYSLRDKEYIEKEIRNE